MKTDGGLLVFGGGHGARECELNERGMCRTIAGRTLAAKHVLQLTAASRVTGKVLISPSFDPNDRLKRRFFPLPNPGLGG